MSIHTIGKALSLVAAIADKRKACEPTIAFSDEKPPFSEKPQLEKLERVIPETVDLDSNRLALFIERVRDTPEIGAESILVGKNEKVCLEANFGISRSSYWKNTFSECKTLTGIAIGMLYDEKRIRPEERLVDIMPDRLSPLQKLGIGQTTVHQLLTMQSMAIFNEAQSMVTEDWVKGFITGGTRVAAGNTFQYNSLNTFMLSAIVERRAGMNLFDYLKDKLFDPMGIHEVYWEKCPQGIPKGGWGLYIMTEDLLKIGMMMLGDGVYQGRRYLSQKWLSMMGTVQAVPPSNVSRYRYGYQMWLSPDENCWLFNGMYGQNLILYRKQKIAIACNASNSDIFQMNPFFAICDQTFLRDTSTSVKKRNWHR